MSLIYSAEFFFCSSVENLPQVTNNENISTTDTNTIDTQEKALGRKLTEDEIKVIDEKITKFYPTAK